MSTIQSPHDPNCPCLVLSPLQVESLIDVLCSSSPTHSHPPSRHVFSNYADPTKPRRHSSYSPSPWQRFHPFSYQASMNSFTQQQHPKATGEHAMKSVCPKCLGCNPHCILKCNSPTLWNGGKCYITARTSEGHLIDPKGEVLCMDLQRPNGCSLVYCSANHQYSRCGFSTHGTQACNLAQAFTSALTL
jgi:hypothetical protein